MQTLYSSAWVCWLPSVAPEPVIDELRAKLERLEQERAACEAKLSEAQRASEESAERAQAALDELQYFVYAASHDLQQPLRAVSTHAQLLQRHFPDDETARELTKVIVESAGQMNGLITDLLTYSRTGNNPQPKPINLDAPLQWALFTLAKAIGESKASVTVGEMADLEADERQLASVFEHLIGNAIKFRGGADAKIHVDSKAEDHAVVVWVQDNGPGIKPQYLEQVFEPFKRLHGREIPGSGLGLSMCRKILRAHRGKMWIESDGQNGATVKFVIPL